MSAAEAPWWEQRLVEHGERICLHAAEGSCSYVELTAALAAGRTQLAQQGIQPGDRVVLIGDYGRDSIGLLLALTGHGAVVIPVVSTASAEAERRASIVAATHVVTALPGNVQWARRAPSA